MTEFAQEVGGWHDFYTMIGLAAATLVGLLFLGLSLRPDVLRAEASSGSPIMATQTFANFLSILIVAAVLRHRAAVAFNAMEKSKEILRSAEQAGYELASTGHMNRATLARVSQPLIGQEEYRHLLNQ